MIDRKFRLARHWSNRELRKLAPHFKGVVANVSAGDDIDKEGATYREYFANASEYHTTNYMPGAFRGFHGRADEHLLDLTGDVPAELEQRFDAVLCHTVFEHIFDVPLAFRNMCTLTRDVAIVIVPFAQVQHESESYQDFWRFTPRCLSNLFERNGMKVVYESWNDEPDASVYILTVASRNPEVWANTFPQDGGRALPGDWIGKQPEQFKRGTSKGIFGSLSKVRRILPRVGFGGSSRRAA